MTLRLWWALALLWVLGWGQGQRSDLQTVQAIQNVPLTVAQGTLVGQQAGGVAWFLGVPFAEPPVGGQRWRAPRPARAWSGVRQAKTFGATCVQGQGGREDCLYLNIYKPVGAKNAPLMVWVHGGFFTGGSANIFDGSALAQQYGVVVVSVNYRVGLMGFLAANGLGDGNYGLYDLLEALRWLRQNASSLGVDPNNVTMFGNSAGGAAICGLLASPLSSGLFQKAILQSGSCTSPIFVSSLEEARRNGQTYLKHFNCGQQAVGDCLRSKPIRALTRYPLPSRQPFSPVPLPMVYGGSLLPKAPVQAIRAGLFNKMPVLLGSNREELRVFEPYIPGWVRQSRVSYALGLGVLDAKNAIRIGQEYQGAAGELPLNTLLRLMSDRYFACPNAWLSRQLSYWSPTYAYEFSDQHAPFEVSKKSNDLGPVHGSEIPFVFSTGVMGVSGPADFNFAQRQLARQIGEYWTTFAKAGRPQALGLTPWPPVTPLHQGVLNLNSGRTVWQKSFSTDHRCAFWDGLDR